MTSNQLLKARPQMKLLVVSRYFYRMEIPKNLVLSSGPSTLGAKTHQIKKHQSDQTEDHRTHYGSRSRQGLCSEVVLPITMWSSLSIVSPLLVGICLCDCAKIALAIPFWPNPLFSRIAVAMRPTHGQCCLDARHNFRGHQKIAGRSAFCQMFGASGAGDRDQMWAAI